MMLQSSSGPVNLLPESAFERISLATFFAGVRMPLITPIAGLRPALGRAEDVLAPPYDVVSRAEAKAMVADRPWSFLHISRPEIDLADNVDAYAPAVYAKARENFDRLITEGVLVRDAAPNYYVYRLTMGAHVQTGLVAGASVAAYADGRIKKHELTRPAKEDDRVRQIDALNAQTGPVLLVYPSAPEIDAILANVADRTPEVNVIAPDGVQHQMWVVCDAVSISRLTDAFAALPALYVADGHHRSAAAWRVSSQRRAEHRASSGEAAYDYFLSVAFPHVQMQILDYNRVVRDLNGLGSDQLLARIGEAFDVELTAHAAKPQRRGEFAMYLDGHWYRLRIDGERIPADDPVRRLDVSVLQDNLIQPLLGISDPRRDERIDFVGGIRGLGALQERVDSGAWAVAFALVATSMEALMAVADVGEVMPPKSTWFEPKLADGLVSHVLD
jgi:uncharacterized protein (DUF1015 family)